MTEFYTLRFRQESKLLYAAHGSKFDGCPTTLWYAVRTAALAHKFKSPQVAHRVLRGAKVFQNLLSEWVWEIVHHSERVVESGTHGIRILGSRRIYASDDRGSHP